MSKSSERVVLLSPEEKNARCGSTKQVFQRSNSSRKGKGLVEKSVKKVAEGSTREESTTWRGCRERCVLM